MIATHLHLIVLLLVGCGDDAAVDEDVLRDLSATDLSAVAANDLASSDLAAWPDLADHDMTYFCSGTALAASCAYPYFVQLAQCYQPKGYCDHFASPGADHVRWENCAQWEANPAYVGYSDGATCLRITSVLDGGGTQGFEFGNAVLTWDPASGTITCPGGAQSVLGSFAAACPALAALLTPDAASCMQQPDETARPCF